MKYKIGILSLAMATIVLFAMVAGAGVSAAKFGTVSAPSTVGASITGAPVVCWDGSAYWTVAQGAPDAAGNTIYWQTPNAGGPWTALGAGTNPTVVALGVGNVVVAATGTNGALWAKETINDGVSWTNVALPTLVPKAGTGATAVFLAATPELNVLYVATNGNLMDASLNLATASTSLSNLGGNVFATPAAAATSNSSMDVVVKGTGSAIWQMPYAMGGFGSWNKLHDGTIGAGASLASDAFATPRPDALAASPETEAPGTPGTNLFLAVSGTNGRLYMAWSDNDGVTWVTNYQQGLVPLNTHALYWANLGGVVASAPSAFVVTPGFGQAVVRGGDGDIWVNTEALPGAGAVPPSLIINEGWFGPLLGP